MIAQWQQKGACDVRAQGSATERAPRRFTVERETGRGGVQVRSARRVAAARSIAFRAAFGDTQ
ncbi:hypothetical protein [Burkholderia oklahomensis]|uniref:hypothetical protein n=1 Tax=Burkholderia oklahomensis TaxID=342113 RepID=UPI00030BC91A|nr:hypothetical protein [Burkholderia oklahomensis]MBI0359604.1 hypothetical protein [Burkholderia oklahomensis]QPS38900.1 hypothetical protein I6G57_08865 [Burkholderia oklahomensis]